MGSLHYFIMRISLSNLFYYLKLSIGLLIILISFLFIPFSYAQGITGNIGDAINISHTDGFSGFPSITCDRTGRIHVFWSEGVDTDYGGAGDTIYYSYRDGGNWSIPNGILISPIGDRANFPSSVVDTQGYLHLIWGGGPFVPLYYSRAHTNDAQSARSWINPVELAPAAYAPDIAIGPEDDLHIAYSQPGLLKDVSEGIYIVNSSDGGKTWSHPVLIDLIIESTFFEPEWVRLTIDPKGRIHVVWNLVDDKNGTGIYYSRSEDSGQTWSAPKLLAVRDQEDYTTELADIAVINEDEVHVVYLDGDQAYRYHIWSSDGGNTWSMPQEILNELVGQAGFADLAVDSDDNLHLTVDMRGRPKTGNLHGHWWGSLKANKWSPPKLIAGANLSEEGKLHLQHPRIDICEGNILVIASHSVSDWDIYFSSTNIPSQHIPPVPYPTVQPASDPTPTPKQDTKITTQTDQINNQSSELTIEESKIDLLQNPLVLITISIFPVVLIISIIAFRKFSKRH